MHNIHIREKFTKHFLDSDLLDLFNNMCDMVEGTFDPWEKINDLKLRFYEFDEEEFDFENWLINAGQFILTVKAHVMLHEEASDGEVSRLCKHLSDTLDAIKGDFLDDERQYYYSFSVLAEFLKFYVKEDVTDEQASEIERFVESKLRDLGTEESGTRYNAIALIVPFVLDAIKIHPATAKTLLRVLDRLVTAMSADQARLDEVLGLCVRTLAFTDYTTASPDELFGWALAAKGHVVDQFTDLTCNIHLAIGHALRGEPEPAESLLAASLAKIEPLPTPKKEIQLGFLMRGCIEAGVVSGSTFDAVANEFQQMTQRVVERIQALNADLNQPPSPDGQEQDQDQDAVEEKVHELESVFIIFSGILDNLSLAGVHSRNAGFLRKVEDLIGQVQEINIIVNFSTKLASYYREIGDSSGKARDLIVSTAETMNQEVEHVFLEDLLDFFLEFSRTALELAYHEEDPWYVDQLEALFNTIKTRKNLDEDNLEALQYQVLSAMNSLLSAMWNDHFGKALLQGFSSAID